MREVFRRNAYPLPVLRSTVEADFQGFTFSVFHDAPGQVWADFTHETDAFVVIVEGDVVIEVAGETVLCGPGDLVRIPAEVTHTLRTSRAGGSTYFQGYGSFGCGDG